MEIQDNLSKAREIANLCEHCIESNGRPCDGCMECEHRGEYYGAKTMAEDKDIYFRTYLENKLSTFEKQYEETHSEYMAGVCDGIRSVINCLFN